MLEVLAELFARVRVREPVGHGRLEVPEFAAAVVADA